ncbi:imidazole glycerol phosphate synthase subunit HisH [Candidatus Pelagibacter sp.]|nr:imidazole glycerol phosphate synthase subunit HisH [Candidatus Pelagibacter sp.]
MKKICIIDYKINNISSIKKAVQETGHEFNVIDNGEQLDNYSHIILPGIGSFEAGVRQLKRLNFFEPLIKNKNKIYFFGICLGMQLLLEKSEEDKNGSNGLGIIKGSVKKILAKKNFNVYCPHIGWNNIYAKDSKNLFNINEKKDFYFANSFYVDPDDKNLIEYYFFHGAEYPSIIKKDNIFGVQFHPEKSKEGIKILNDFCSLG